MVGQISGHLAVCYEPTTVCLVSLDCCVVGCPLLSIVVFVRNVQGKSPGVIHLSMVCPTWADVGERSGFCCRNLPQGVGTYSPDCNIQTPISPCHTLSMTGNYGVFVRIGRGMVHRIVPQVWGLVPSGHGNSPCISHQAPGIGGKVYH